MQTTQHSDFSLEHQEACATSSAAALNKVSTTESNRHTSVSAAFAATLIAARPKMHGERSGVEMYVVCVFDGCAVMWVMSVA